MRLPFRENGRLGDQRGMVLVMGMVLSIALVALGTAYLIFFNFIRSSVDDDIRRVQAYYAAYRAVIDGVYYARAYQPATRVPPVETHYYDNVYYSFGIGAQEGTYWLSNWTDYDVFGYGDAYNVKKSHKWSHVLKYGYKAETFADYLWLTNNEVDTFSHQPVRFWTPDTLDGKVHSNNYIYIHETQNRPVFYEPVSTCKEDLNPPRRSLNPGPDFRKGFFPNSPPIIFPSQADTVRRYAIPPYTFGSPGADSVYYIRIFGDYFKWQRKARNQVVNNNPAAFSNDWTEVPNRLPLPPLKAIFVNGKLFIDAPRRPGVSYETGLNGRVTIGASDTIFIINHILYNCSDTSGRVPITCDDALGLVSERWIMVSKYINTYSGHPVYPAATSFKINAALAVLNGSFACQGVYDNSVAEFRSLFIHGCIAQKNRGTIHRGTAGYGYGFVEKDYKFDHRFVKNPPPHWVPTGRTRMIYTEVED